MIHVFCNEVFVSNFLHFLVKNSFLNFQYIIERDNATYCGGI